MRILNYAFLATFNNALQVLRSMHYKTFKLDKFQEEAISSIEKNHSVVVSAPTGSGKTLIADYIINKDVLKGIRVVYTAPIKALSNQKYKQFTEAYGAEKVGLLTGDIVKNPAAPLLIMTTEIYRNMVLTGDESISSISYVIFDEIHYINDIERGVVWEESIIFSKPNVRFLCLSATVPNAQEFADWIHSIKKHPVDVIYHDERSVPLEGRFFDSEMGIASLEQIREVAGIPDYDYFMGRSRRRTRRITAPSHIDLIGEIIGKLPCFFFNFSRKKCQDNAAELAKAGIFKISPEISSFVRKKLSEAPPEINQLQSVRLLRNILPFGIGFHHAGLIPIAKELVEELFSKGLIKVLYTTETFAVGINMPAKTVCFESLRKYDGANHRFLNSKEYFQIAGRAGRRGIDQIGYSFAMVNRRDFDYGLLKKITNKDTEPIMSQFRLSVNTALNLIKRHTEEEIGKILLMNFYTFQRYNSVKSEITHSFENIKRKLIHLHYLHDGKLTGKGEFAAKIYADEILLGEIFATDFCKELNEFQILLILACLCYEPREKTEFYKLYPGKWAEGLKHKISRNEYLHKEHRFKELENLTALVHLCYYGKGIFEIIKNTNLLEGDLIRFFRQVLDRLNQVREASNNHDLAIRIDGCKKLVRDCISEIDAEV